VFPFGKVHIICFFSQKEMKVTENYSSELVTVATVADKCRRLGLFNLRDSLYDSSAA